MEALVQEKILSSFVNEVSVESETIKPINVDIKTINVTRMIQIKTMVTNDGDYFIKYGGEIAMKRLLFIIKPKAGRTAIKNELFEIYLLYINRCFDMEYITHINGIFTQRTLGRSKDNNK